MAFREDASHIRTGRNLVMTLDQLGRETNHQAQAGQLER